MPLYEYKCANCGEVFEVIQKFSDAPLETHAKCGGGPVERLLSAPGLHFKGTGWYITDYARKNGGGGGSADGKSKTKSESDSSSTTESKPAAPAASSGTTDSK